MMLGEESSPFMLGHQHPQSRTLLAVVSPSTKPPVPAATTTATSATTATTATTGAKVQTEQKSEAKAASENTTSPRWVPADYFEQPEVTRDDRDRMCRTLKRLALCVRAGSLATGTAFLYLDLILARMKVRKALLPIVAYSALLLACQRHDVDVDPQELCQHALRLTKSTNSPALACAMSRLQRAEAQKRQKGRMLAPNGQYYETHPGVQALEDALTSASDSASRLHLRQRHRRTRNRGSSSSSLRRSRRRRRRGQKEAGDERDFSAVAAFLPSPSEQEFAKEREQVAKLCSDLQRMQAVIARKLASQGLAAMDTASDLVANVVDALDLEALPPLTLSKNSLVDIPEDEEMYFSMGEDDERDAIRDAATAHAAHYGEKYKTVSTCSPLAYALACVESALRPIYQDSPKCTQVIQRICEDAGVEKDEFARAQWLSAFH